MTDTSFHIAALTVFPLKSARGIPLLSARVGNTGLVGDRAMMVIDEDGKALTARAEPALMQVRVELDGDEVMLFAPGKRPLTIRRATLAPSRGPVRVWSDEVSAHDGGNEAALWFSEYLGRPTRLVLQDDRRPRKLDLGAGGIVSLADTAPLLLTNEASLDELNLYLDRSAEMERFRPNVVVTGAPAFDEDGWAAIRIGEVEFEVAGACDRCVMITLDPQTGSARPDLEPLALLGKQRRGPDGKVYFGQFLIPRAAGRIHTGDPVEIIARKRPLAIAKGTARKAVKLPVPQAGTAPLDSDDRILTCVGITDETPDMRTFRFSIDRSFAYMPGQFITLMPVINGTQIRRNYTISSSPSRPLQIAITVKSKDDGLVSRWLHDIIRPGAQLAARGPNGRFHLAAAGEEKKLLFASAGSGVTPMMSMLRFAADADLDRDIVFHHSARTAQDMPFVEELRLLKRQLGERLTISWNLTGVAGTGDADVSGIIHAGRLGADMLRNICPDLAQRTVLCCGPAGFRAAVRRICEAWQPGPPPTFLEESFGADPDAEDLPPIGTYSVTFQRASKTVSGNGTTTLLAAAREAGLDMRSDCEAGICGTCRCTVIEGEWRIAANAADHQRTVLSEEEKEAGVVLACSTSPIGPVIVDL